ncbi:two-component system histidine kinase PnpS [Clostridium thermarum]|uniref:two-component system histidine kinase PnpS n=1 Tax=Clostridium thermarum TaxID=1716543 RepID=UPI00111E9D4D|nr:HAMP domain-containing sensor histidine kinase [Clostridium thermarum]
MKKKLMFFILSTIVFCLALTIALYVLISNYEYTEIKKKELALNNEIISKIIKEYKIDISSGKLPFSSELEKYDYRLTIIDKDGHVIYETQKTSESMEKHNESSEVTEARAKGLGISIRYSSSLRKNMIYVATRLDGNIIIRSSKPIETLSAINTKYLKYYIILIIVILAMTLAISSRLSYIIIKPIKDLQYITGRVAKGELEKRVVVTSKDEIGQLGKTFNYMASRLQDTLKDLVDKQNKLEAILKSMDSGVIAIDRNNRIMMINPYAKKIFGIDKDIIGKKLVDHIKDLVIDELLHGADGSQREIRVSYPHEKILRIRTAELVNNSEHMGTVAVVQDITEIKRLEHMRSDFVANVSHELKTPLTSIKGFAETLKYVEDKATKEKFLDIINDEAERLTRLINDILTLSDLENHIEERKELIDVKETIMQVYNLMKQTAEDKTINLEFDLQQGCRILGSTDKFKQMMINLVDNAIKYSETGDNVEIGCAQEEEHCVIWVKDNGVGIPKDHIPRIFERFYRVDKARSRAKGGTGLGLAIVKHIVIGLKGTIDVESELGQGSKFTIKIPVV